MLSPRTAVIAVLAFVAAPIGCAPSNHYADPEIKNLNPAESSLIVEPRGNPVIVVSVDGKAAGTRSDVQGRQFWVRPGIHHVVVKYNDGARMSAANAEVSFVSEAGGRYQMERWPPKVKDLATKKVVPHQVRGSE